MTPLMMRQESPHDDQGLRGYLVRGTRGRVFDRRRLQLLPGGNGPDAVVRAVDAYRNPDGDGWT